MYTNNSVHIVYPAFETYSIKKKHELLKKVHSSDVCTETTAASIMLRFRFWGGKSMTVLHCVFFCPDMLLLQFECWDHCHSEKWRCRWLDVFHMVLQSRIKILGHFFINFNKIPNTKISPELSQPLHHVIQMAVGTHCFASLLTKSWQQSFHRDHFGWGFSKK